MKGFGMDRIKIAQLYADAQDLGGKTVTVAGWVKSVRDMKNFGFCRLMTEAASRTPAGRYESRSP